MGPEKLSLCGLSIPEAKKISTDEKNLLIAMILKHSEWVYFGFTMFSYL
jgi:hypothetical protein